MDGGGYSSSDILAVQNSPSSNVQGCTLLDERANLVAENKPARAGAVITTQFPEQTIKYRSLSLKIRWPML